MATKAKQKTFEESAARLDEILNALEEGNTDLDEALKLYEEGIGLIRSCNRILENAEQRVKMLRMGADGGELVDFSASGEES